MYAQRYEDPTLASFSEIQGLLGASMPPQCGGLGATGNNDYSSSILNFESPSYSSTVSMYAEQQDMSSWLACENCGTPSPSVAGESKFTCSHKALFCSDCEAKCAGACPQCEKERDAAEKMNVSVPDDNGLDALAQQLSDVSTDPQSVPSGVSFLPMFQPMNDLMSLFDDYTEDADMIVPQPEKRARTSSEEPNTTTTTTTTTTTKPSQTIATPVVIQQLQRKAKKANNKSNNNTTSTNTATKKSTRKSTDKTARATKSKVKVSDTPVSQIGPIRSRRTANPKDYGGLTDKEICDTPYETLMHRITSFDEPLKDKIKERRRQLKNRVHARKAANKREIRQVGLSGENQRLQEESERLMKENERLMKESAQLEYQHILIDLEKSANEEAVANLREQVSSLRAILEQKLAQGSISEQMWRSDSDTSSASSDIEIKSTQLHMQLAATTLQ